MADEKHDAGFKVVDRRSFATDTATTGSEPASQARQGSSAETPGSMRPEAGTDAGPIRDSGPRIEIPGDESDFAIGGAPPAGSGFDTLVSYLGTTAMFQLGLVAGPSGERIPTDLPNARHTIDMLDVLQEKTRGNLTDDEVQLLEEVLYELRMAYVEVEKRVRPK